MDTRTMGEKIADLIKEREITYSELTEYCNKNGAKCSNATISNICNDVDKGYSYKVICCIADYFNVSVDFLLSRTENKTIDDELRFVCDFTTLSEDFICELKSFYPNLVEQGTVAECELDYIIKSYNDIFLLMIKNVHFLWRIMQCKLSLGSLIRKEKDIQQILTLQGLNEDLYRNIDDLDIMGFRLQQDFERYGLQKFLALEDCRKIIEDYIKLETIEYERLLKENRLNYEKLTPSERELIFDFPRGINNANS